LNGARSKAKSAVKTAKDAETLLDGKDGKAEQVLNGVRRAQQTAQIAEQEAQAAYDLANEAKERSMGELQQVSVLTEKIQTFTTSDKATPENVKELADQCLAAELRLDDSTITDIAQKIEAAIANVADVEGILRDTSGDLGKVQLMAKSANDAEKFAQDQLDKANNVTDDLTKAEEAQNEADNLVQSSQTKIDSARKDLAQIANDMEKATNAADASVVDVRDLTNRQIDLQTQYIKNENRVNAAQNAAEDAKTQAVAANAELYLLNTGFKNVTTTLTTKIWQWIYKGERMRYLIPLPTNYPTLRILKPNLIQIKSN